MHAHRLAPSFQELHRHGMFLMPNPWDIGSARLLQALGFPAVATTSAGLAFAAGRADKHLGWSATLAHLRALVAELEIPISADLENGFTDRIDDLADRYRQVASMGIAGASIEDTSGTSPLDQYDTACAAARVSAAAQAIRASGQPFMLTARAENFFIGRCDLRDTIDRLQAYQAAGADVLFAPGLKRLTDIREVLRSIDRPLNVLAGIPGSDFTLADLAEAGVRRVSFGASLARAAFGALRRAALEIRDLGTLQYAGEAIPAADLNLLLGCPVAGGRDRPRVDPSLQRP